MKLSELLATLGQEQLRAEVLARTGKVTVGDVLVHDPPQPIERGQIVLAVGTEASSPEAERLVSAAAEAGAVAVTFRESPEPGPIELAERLEISLLRADPRIGWAKLVTLLRTLISATMADPEAHGERLAPSSVHGLADAIAVMLGGSVVLYDRAHRVVAYSVQGFEIDNVRRDTIFGRRTPEQWIGKFIADRSAYETFRDPNTVVRVDGYPGLHPRLRVAVCFEGEVLGEISVAEDAEELGPESEPALLRAATLAAPFMLRHRFVEDTDRATRTRLLHGLLRGTGAPADQALTELGIAAPSGFAVVGFTGAGDEQASGVWSERIQHLLSMHMSSIAETSGVVLADSVYYALVPISRDEAGTRLAERIRPALRQLERMSVPMRAAIGPWVSAIHEVPGSRETVEDLLRIADRAPEHDVYTVDELWPEIALLPVERAVSESRFTPCEPLRLLLHHDQQQRTEYVQTLRVYLDEFGSVSKASERLLLHPNTLRHRLQRIGELSGLELTDPTQRLAVTVQLRVLEFTRT